MCIRNTSRGCPFLCEFCDIIEVFGAGAAREDARAGHRRARGAAPCFLGIAPRGLPRRRQLHRQQEGGPAHPGRARALQEERGHPFTFYTEASLNLAADDRLVAAMRAARFTSVFIGIEHADPRRARS